LGREGRATDEKEGGWNDRMLMREPWRGLIMSGRKACQKSRGKRG